MTWTAVQSSNLEAYEYEADTQTLRIRFSAGRVFTYRNVPQQVAEGLGTAQSPGRYFNAAIKDQYS